MTPQDLRVFARGHAREGTYLFTCPDCVLPVQRPASTHVVALLSAVGAVTMVGGINDALDSQWDRGFETLPSGPPFTLDDLIVWHFLLEDDDSLARFFASALD